MPKFGKYRIKNQRSCLIFENPALIPIQMYRYHSKISHIAGTTNVMADDCSRLWHLTDEELLTHFNLHYPQNLPWKECTLWPEMNFAFLSTLLR
jgi:hypothetical protein